jgi:hypothetical protein
MHAKNHLLWIAAVTLDVFSGVIESGGDSEPATGIALENGGGDWELEDGSGSWTWS